MRIIASRFVRKSPRKNSVSSKCNRKTAVDFLLARKNSSPRNSVAQPSCHDGNTEIESNLRLPWFRVRDFFPVILSAIRRQFAISVLAIAGMAYPV